MSSGDAMAAQLPFVGVDGKVVSIQEHPFQRASVMDGSQVFENSVPPELRYRDVARLAEARAIPVIDTPANECNDVGWALEVWLHDRHNGMPLSGRGGARVTPGRE